MAVPTPEQYTRMLDAAADGGFAFPAVNVTSSATLNAALRGFADARSDGIVQVTVGGAAYLAGPSGDAATGARALALAAHELAAPLPVAIAVHTDHCPPAHVDDFLRPLLHASIERRARGELPLFHSQMFDGSSLPLDENLRRAAELLVLCREAGVLLEVEVGVVGGEEDGIGDEPADRERLYTTPEEMLRVAEVLGTGERGRYLLAATFGNVHGIGAPQDVELRPHVLAAGRAALAAAHDGARFAFVFHGSSGSSDDELREAVGEGVVKVNLDSEAQYAFTRAVAAHVFEHYDGVLAVDGHPPDKAAFDPRAWGRRGEASMGERVARACAVLGSAGRSIVG